MDSSVEELLEHVLKRFVGMSFDESTLEYMALEINDALRRTYPDKARDLYVEPFFRDNKILFRTHWLQ